MYDIIKEDFPRNISIYVSFSLHGKIHSYSQSHFNIMLDLNCQFKREYGTCDQHQWYFMKTYKTKEISKGLHQILAITYIVPASGSLGFIQRKKEWSVNGQMWESLNSSPRPWRNQHRYSPGSHSILVMWIINRVLCHIYCNTSEISYSSIQVISVILFYFNLIHIRDTHDFINTVTMCSQFGF